MKVKWIYLALSRETSKALRHGSHNVTCNYTYACLYLVSIYQMAPPQTEVNEHLIAAYSSFIYRERMKG